MYQVAVPVSLEVAATTATGGAVVVVVVVGGGAAVVVVTGRTEATGAYAGLVVGAGAVVVVKAGADVVGVVVGAVAGGVVVGVPRYLTSCQLGVDTRDATEAEVMAWVRVARDATVARTGPARSKRSGANSIAPTRSTTTSARLPPVLCVLRAPPFSGDIAPMPTHGVDGHVRKTSIRRASPGFGSPEGTGQPPSSGGYS